jgi:hypothetical protein
MNPLAPGGMGFFVHSGVVHPQVVVTFLITSGDVPEFLNEKSYMADPAVSLTLPKSCVVLSKVMTGCAATEDATSNATNKKYFFMKMSLI